MRVSPSSQTLLEIKETGSVSDKKVNGTKVNSGAFICIENIRKSFGAQQVLAGVSLTIAKGESVALLGANGSGKSTLLKCLVRLVEPDSGSIHINETDLVHCSKNELRRTRADIGIVFQMHNLVPRVSALTNVIHGCLGRTSSPLYWSQTFAPHSVREKAMECLQSVGLAHRAARQANRLSGGESQRVAIARALMQDPSILLADEPIASLDPKIGHEVMALFRQIFYEREKTFVFVSHDLDCALAYADRIVGLKNGTILIDTPSAEVKRSDLAEIYH